MMKVVEKMNFSTPVKMSLSSPYLDQVDPFFLSYAVMITGIFLMCISCFKYGIEKRIHLDILLEKYERNLFHPLPFSKI